MNKPAPRPYGVVEEGDTIILVEMPRNTNSEQRKVFHSCIEKKTHARVVDVGDKKLNAYVVFNGDNFYYNLPMNCIKRVKSVPPVRELTLSQERRRRRLARRRRRELRYL